MQNGGMNPFGSPSPTGSYASYASSPQPTYQSHSPSLAARSPSPGVLRIPSQDVMCPTQTVPCCVPNFATDRHGIQPSVNNLQSSCAASRCAPLV